MTKYSVNKDTCDSMLDELINMLIDAKEKNGVGLRDMEITSNFDSSLPEYKVRITLVKYK